MLFLSDAIFRARQKILRDLDNNTIDAEQGFRQLLALDPEDHVSLMFLGEARAKAGDSAGAAEMYWRAVHAQPCSWPPYMRLSMLLSDQEPLSKGLAELACRKVALDPGAVEEMEDEESPFSQFGQGVKELEGLSGQENFETMADLLREERDREPVTVTARLRSLRLVHELQEAESLEPNQVEAFLQEGESIVPLLVGVLRGWAQEVLPEEKTSLLEVAVGLLGEIGDASAIPSLLELVTLEDVFVSGPAGWALDRIVEQNPDEAGRVFTKLADRLDGQEKIAVAARLLRFPQLVATADLFERLFDNLNLLEAEDREACFQILISTAIMVLAPAGLDFARSMLRLRGAILPRKARRDCEEMIQEFGSIAIPPRPPAEPSPWTVYDVCEGTIDWEAEEEESMEEDDESLSPEPVRKPETPGRNDPCWCGSGKKYKKCHLDADETSRRS